MYDAYNENTLKLNQDLCIGCRLCVQVCPHSVFEMHDGLAFLKHSERCMECGACQINCQPEAISVDNGVGCASAMIYAAVTGRKEPVCGGSAGGCC